MTKKIVQSRRKLVDEADLTSVRNLRMSLSEPETFRSFYEVALPRVYTYLVRRCASVPTAEDLTQETFLAVVREIRRGKSPGNPVAWAVGIAKHKLVDYYRKERVAERITDWHWLEQDPGGSREARAEADERILIALRAVSTSQQEALVLRYVEGMSVPELAAALGRSVHAAESLLARGRESFKRNYLEVYSE